MPQETRTGKRNFRAIRKTKFMVRKSGDRVGDDMINKDHE